MTTKDEVLRQVRQLRSVTLTLEEAMLGRDLPDALAAHLATHLPGIAATLRELRAKVKQHPVVTKRGQTP